MHQTHGCYAKIAVDLAIEREYTWHTETREGQMKDITGRIVEITHDTKGNVWVNVDGKCELRAYRSKEIYLQSDLIYSEVKEPVE